jgi:hypothetical protein
MATGGLSASWVFQRLFLIEVFPALAFSFADLQQAHDDYMEALECAGDMSRRLINGYARPPCPCAQRSGVPRGGQLSLKGVTRGALAGIESDMVGTATISLRQ